MDIVDFFKWSGCIMNTFAALPQVITSRKRNSTSELHFGTMVLRFFGGISMMVFGFLQMDLIFIVVNIIISFFELLLILAKCRDSFT